MATTEHTAPDSILGPVTAHSMNSYTYLRSFQLRVGGTGTRCSGVHDALGPVLFLTLFKV